MAQMVKTLAAMQETQVPSLGQEDSLEKKMATYSSIPVWRIPWTEDPGGLQCMGPKEWDTTERLTLSLSLSQLPVSTIHPLHYVMCCACWFSALN